MESKGKIILFSTLLLSLFLIGVYFSGLANAVTISTLGTAMNTSGESGGLVNITNVDKWTMAGRSESFNITINATTNSANITKTLNITNLTGAAYMIRSPIDIQPAQNGTGTNFNWTFLNTTSSSGGFVLIGNTKNVSSDGVLQNLTFRINITALPTGTEAVYTWNISLYNIYENSTS